MIKAYLQDDKLNYTSIEYERVDFYGGEFCVKIDDDEYDDKDNICVYFTFEKTDEVLELLFLCDSLKSFGCTLYNLFIDYVPFSRQDRVEPGESFSLKVFANLINGLQFKRVTIKDPHSDVTAALINNCEIIHQHDIFQPFLKDKKDFWLVSPDAGALKKVYKLAEWVDSLGVVECSKIRDLKTGQITGTIVHADDLMSSDCYIVDDMCSGGATFIAIAKELKKRNAGRIILMVTHGLFTRPLNYFEGIFDEIYTNKGKVYG